MFMSFVLSLLFFISNPVLAQFAELQKSHIEGNVPSTEAEFDGMMKRDLLFYFKKLHKKTTSVEYRMLRKGATQSGVALPKFYAWVEIKDGKRLIDSGAVRVAAIEKTSMEVTDFLTRDRINAAPKDIELVFPAALCEGIREEAKKSRK